MIEGAGSSPVPPEAAARALGARVDAGHGETWLTHANGRSLGFVTNGERAMVMLLADEDDPGEHAVDPGAGGVGDGYVLANGGTTSTRTGTPFPSSRRTGSWSTSCGRATGRWTHQGPSTADSAVDGPTRPALPRHID